MFFDGKFQSDAWRPALLGVAAREHRESVAAAGHVVAPLQRGYVRLPNRSGTASRSARSQKRLRYDGRIPFKSERHLD